MRRRQPAQRYFQVIAQLLGAKAQRVRLIEQLIDVYRVPWVPDWRLGDLGGRPPRETEPLARLTGALR